MDKLQQLNFNAVVFQVRPHTDAMYNSRFEPWSYYLTGKQGKKPDPYYDPLKFWVKEAHIRGIELHAWFNPYRADHPENKGGLCDTSIVKTKPTLVVKLEKGYYWMNPALKETQEHSLAVVMDVVKRYDIDGIHFDDYFYPYKSYNNNKDFPDDKSWQNYKKSGGKLTKNDWRRKAVNNFIRQLYTKIKKTKPHVKFGISPFGIWRPGHPKSIEGLDQYDVLYADAKLWLNSGWIDYFSPQLYWAISKIPQSFPVLLAWWEKENIKGRNLWPGLYIGRFTKDQAGVIEIINQIMITRGIVSNNPGNIMFSMKVLTKNKEKLGNKLLATVYKKQALCPPYKWLDSTLPCSPEVEINRDKNDNFFVTWKQKGKEKAFVWVLYTKNYKTWDYKILPSQYTRVKIDKSATDIIVTSVDRCGNESKKSIIHLKKAALIKNSN